MNMHRIGIVGLGLALFSQYAAAVDSTAGLPDIDPPAQALLTDDVDFVVEIRVEEFEHFAQHHALFGAALPKDDRDIRIAEARSVVSAVVGKDDLQMVLLAISNAIHQTSDELPDHGNSPGQPS